MVQEKQKLKISRAGKTEKQAMQEVQAPNAVRILSTNSVTSVSWKSSTLKEESVLALVQNGLKCACFAEVHIQRLKVFKVNVPWLHSWTQRNRISVRRSTNRKVYKQEGLQTGRSTNRKVYKQEGLQTGRSTNRKLVDLMHGAHAKNRKMVRLVTT